MPQTLSNAIRHQVLVAFLYGQHEFAIINAKRCPLEYSLSAS